GSNIAGLQTAAQGLLGIGADAVNIPPAAFLAVLPRSPSMYTPFIRGGGLKDDNDLEAGLKSVKTDANCMYEDEFITKDEYEAAIDYDIAVDSTQPKKAPSEKYSRLTEELERRAKDILLSVVAEEDGYTMEDLNNNEQLMSEYKEIVDHDLRMRGYNIHST